MHTLIGILALAVLLPTEAEGAGGQILGRQQPESVVNEIVYDVVTEIRTSRENLDNSSAAFRQWRVMEDGWIERLASIDPTTIANGQTRQVHGVLLSDLESFRDLRACNGHLWGFANASLRGLPQVVSLSSQFDIESPSATASELLESMLPRVARYVDREIANLREGASTGYTAPRLIVERWIDESERLLSIPVEASPFLTFANDSDFSVRAREVVERDVVPAIVRYRDFLRDEYLAEARDTPGLSSLPNGMDCWQAEVRRHTTMNLKIDAIDALVDSAFSGAAVVWDSIAREEHGFADGRAYLDDLYDDSSWRFSSWEDALASAHALQERVSDMVPEYFTHVPSGPRPSIEVRPEAEHIMAYYAGGTSPRVVLNSNAVSPGVNRRNLAILVLHEGVPGHHLQRQVARPSIFGVPVFVEGWASYAEELLVDNLDSEPDIRFTEALSEMRLYRAVATLVSNGIHSKGWSTDTAMSTLREYFGGSEADLKTRLETIVLYPGLHFRYTVGNGAFLALRRDAESRLGSLFDEKVFHQLVLEDGPVTLSMLREKVESWVAHQLGGEARQ